ncbi:MAG: hypothetical protein QM757_02105 [Paludibaculum sp.]
MPAFPDDKTEAPPKLPSEVADKLYATVARIAAAGEEWRACIVKAGVDYTQLRDIRTRHAAVQSAQQALQEEFSSTRNELNRLNGVRPRTADIQTQFAAQQKKWAALQAQNQKLLQQIQQFDADEKAFLADLKAQQFCFERAPAAIKALIPTEQQK